MKKLLVQLTDKQHEQIRKIAYEKHISMSEVVRAALKNFMTKEITL